MIQKTYHFITVFIILSFSLFAQEADSIKSYTLGEVTIQGGIVLEPQTVIQIKGKQLENADVSSVAGLAKFIPSVKMQTSSRGESMFYFRGSNKRQLLFFLDGAQLNTPWDNTIDLSVIPVNAIGGITVTRGVPSVIYGANALAGVVNLTTVEPPYQGDERKFNVLLGENNFQKYSAYWNGNKGSLSYLAAFSYFKTEGYTLPDNYKEPTDPDYLRTNSQSGYFSGFGKLGYSYGTDSNLDFSVTYLDASKGVPPENDVANPRYWKYPVWRRLGLTFNGTNKFGESANSILVYTLGFTTLQSQIDQYADIAYSTIDDVEKGDDLVFLGRIIFTKLIGGNSIWKIAASGTASSHKESFLSGNYAELTYAQNIGSVGTEYEYFTERFSITGGVSLDASATPKTGDKPSADPIIDYGFNSSLVYFLTDKLSFQVDFGRKTRFPTLRELFSGALGRFVPNPDLKAESAVTTEISANYASHNFTGGLSLFLIYLKDGIVRVSLPERQLMRVNKDQIRTMGAELTTTYIPNNKFRMNFNLTFMNSFAKNAAGEFADTLEYKPQYLGGVDFIYDITERLNTILEFNFVGEEFGIQEGYEYFRRLPSYALLNFRVGYSFNLSGETKLEIYFRGNNLFDKLYYGQWSLPEAGRQFFGGVSVKF
ncbi:MAG: TonB-dependent receptor [Chlorobi bacterium]|nr:TonB-dependent receptor [Chlorobiota bacterium]